MRDSNTEKQRQPKDDHSKKDELSLDKETLRDLEPKPDKADAVRGQANVITRCSADATTC